MKYKCSTCSWSGGEFDSKNSAKNAHDAYNVSSEEMCSSTPKQISENVMKKSQLKLIIREVIEESSSEVGLFNNMRNNNFDAALSDLKAIESRLVSAAKAAQALTNMCNHKNNQDHGDNFRQLYYRCHDVMTIINPNTPTCNLTTGL